MKKLLPVLCLAMLLIGCAAPSTNQTTVTNANTAATPSPARAISETEIIEREKAIWDAIKNKDYTTFANTLAEEQLETSEMVVNDKAMSVNFIKRFEPTEVNLSNWKVQPLDQDAVVVIYDADVKSKIDGKEFPPYKAHATTAWVDRGGKWVVIYHQESQVRPSSPSPSPTVKSSSPSPAASTAASPAAIPATTSDPIANEKAVWAALKSKNYDAFAAMLDPNSVEVEPDGVFDKAGSVEGVKKIDFSHFEQSDFRALNIDKDAALVTYLVKVTGPKPMTERHTTIWVNRNNKWVAIFHQGTNIPPGTPSPATTASPAKPTSSASPAK
jgi:hypothetical protein